jgi:site-specific recombinase XerD
MKTELAIAEFIEYKRSLGRRYTSRSIILRACVRVAGGLDIRKVTPDIVRKFVDGRGPVTNAWFARFSTLNCLFRYALSRNHVATSPLPKLKPARPIEFRPYIYSTADVRKLLDAAESRHRPSWRLTPRTMRVLLLLLYGAGLRISEAVTLKIADVDLKALVLTIRETKFFKTRLVPIGPDLGKVLRRYFQQQWSASPHTPDSSFLAATDGMPVTRRTAEGVFTRLRKEAGIKGHEGSRYQPRLHDFRHAFAIMRLVTWYREGKNVQRLLLHLSTYLGHARMSETTRYLSITRELLKHASRCFELYARPEAKRD